MSNETSSAPLFLSASDIGSARIGGVGGSFNDSAGGVSLDLEGYFPMFAKDFALSNAKLKILEALRQAS